MDRAPLITPEVVACARALRAAGAQVSVRLVEESSESLAMVRGVLLPLSQRLDAGCMITVMVPHGIGYAATSDLGEAGLASALQEALHRAQLSQQSGLFAEVDLPAPDASNATRVSRRSPADRTRTPEQKPLPSREALVALLRAEAAALKAGPSIVNWSASLVLTRSRQQFFFEGELLDDREQQFVEPNLLATAADATTSQTRSLAGQYNGYCQQGGFEVIERSGLIGGGARVAGDAIELLAAPNCPSGRMSVLLAPDQMMLQIHESIGHPLELDRILGDERNFAGTSFVKPEMFGTYQYGSALLDVSFDPQRPEQLASYALDDEGSAATRTMLIEKGVLKRPLGSALSQSRAQALGHALRGTANARASGWHRAPIDRMANLNVEPGTSSLRSMIAATQRGVFMHTNVSWSIDDSRNKFQFGCEWGRLIENGQLTSVVRNPNYRGVSATFWRNLAMVGDPSTFEVMGTPFCGKGEPGQVLRVGHASPACLFHDVEVFGAAQ